MIVLVPALPPNAIPDAEPIVATKVLPLVQVPPVVALVSVVVAPTHTVKVPVGAGGLALTVTTVEAMQPDGSR